MITKMIELYKRLENVPPVLDALVRGVNNLSEHIRYKAEPVEKHFVVVFIQAVKVIKDDDGFRLVTKERVTLCVTGYAPHEFSFQPDIPIANLEIAIICDVSKVQIRRLIVANQYLCPSIQSAPLAYHAGIVEPCNRISIDVVTW